MEQDERRLRREERRLRRGWRRSFGLMLVALLIGAAGLAGIVVLLLWVVAPLHLTD